LKRLLILLLVLVLIGLVYFFTFAARLADQKFNRVSRAVSSTPPAPARALHDRLTVADLHADFLLWSRDPLERANYGHMDVPRLLEANVALQVFSAVTKSPWGQNYAQNAGSSDRITLLVMGQRWPLRTWFSLKERALYQAERLHRAADASGGKLTIIRTGLDLTRYLQRRAASPDRVAGLLAIEGLHAMEGRLENLDALYEAGYRMMALTHFFDNALSGSAHGVGRGGLTELGRAVIRRQEELGIVVDLAHVSPRAIDEILEMVSRPVVVSHTGVQATCAGPRNLTDDQIDRIADTGGVIGIGFWPGAVCGLDPASIVRAIRHVADRAGTGSVALGSDYDGSIQTGFDVTGLPHLTAALLDDGFTEDEIAQIMGGNVVRVLRDALPPH
jgi:microsomal dipeptidase-like Zn-dependent dipeptidase